MKTLWKKGILNTVEDSGANVVNDTSSKDYRIYATSAGLELLFPPIPYGAVTGTKDVFYQASQAEVTQIVSIIADASGNLETVTSNTRYKVSIDQTMERTEGIQKPFASYAYQSPVVLTGTAATDRLNMYTSLVDKVNSHVSNWVTAYLVHAVAFTSGSDSGTNATGFATSSTTNKVRYGTQGTQQTSGVTCNVALCTVTSGTFVGDDAAGTIYLYNVSALASWSSASKTLTFTDATSGTTETIVVTTNADLTQGQGMVIVDDSGYYAARPSARQGASGIYVSNFATAETAVKRIAYYSRGIGTRMLQDIPTFDLGKPNVVSGDGEFLLNALPVAGKTYATFVINVHSTPNANALEGLTGGNTTQYILYADESTADYVANLKTALEAIV